MARPGQLTLPNIVFDSEFTRNVGGFTMGAPICPEKSRPFLRLSRNRATETQSNQQIEEFSHRHYAMPQSAGPSTSETKHNCESGFIN